MDVVGDDAAAGRGDDEPVFVLQRALGVFVAALPMLAHRRAGEFEVLGVAFVRLLLIDQVQDRHLGLVFQFLEQAAVFIRHQLLRHFEKRFAQPRLPCVHAAEDVGVVARARGIEDVLQARRDLGDVVRQGPPRVEQVDLKHERVQAVLVIQQILQRRVRDDAAVPVMVVADLDAWERGRQRAARHDVFRSDRFVRVVEERQIAGRDVDRADREMDLAGVDQAEVHHFVQRLAQRRGVVVRRRSDGARRAEQGSREARLEEIGLAQRRAHQRRGGVAHLAEDVAVGRVGPNFARRDPAPEFGQPFQAPLQRVAGDQRGVDGADRDA